MNDDLISRSALLDAYDKAHKGPPGGARKLIENAPAVEFPCWISVDERLPDTIPCNAGTAYSEAIIALTSGRKVAKAIYDGTLFFGAFDYWGCEPTERVTHWMPLPELPKEEE